MNIQATLIIVLLILLVVLGVRGEWRALSAPGEAPAATTLPPPAFSVTPVADGQYVMRASDKIFYCVNNRCTGIQLITAPATQSQQAQPSPDNNED